MLLARSPKPRRYAQIEKEALAVTWACEKFTNYILGREFEVETDHKPLIPLLDTKNLDVLPPRVIRSRLRQARFNYRIQYVPGKLLPAADALSRAPATASGEPQTESDEAEAFIEAVTSSYPCSAPMLETYRRAQAEDSTCQQVQKYSQVGWPRRQPTNLDLVSYWSARASFSIHNGLLLFNHRIVIPKGPQGETLAKIHEGHQGIQRCRSRANSSVWWPGLSKQIMQMVRSCPVARRHRSGENHGW